MSSIMAYTQNSDAPKSLGNTYLLQNCFVVVQPGSTLSGQSVLLKDGFIVDIGPNIKPPYDAQIIKTDSMFVYAGFIDAFSHTGMPKSQEKDKPKAQDLGNPTLDLAGVTPQVRAVDSYNSNEKSVEEMRAAGFGISQVVPRGLMLPGQSCIQLLGDDKLENMTIKDASVQNFQLTPSRGVFPSTTIGVIAKFRELYKNASIAGAHEEKYKLNPAGLSRPDHSKELMALYPVTTKKTPLYFVAQKTKDVHKALGLKEELGFEMVLTDVKQGWHYIDQIKKNKINILLSLDLPEEDKKDTKKQTTDITKKDSIATTVQKKTVVKEKNPEQLAFENKKDNSIKQYLSQAATFEKNGIPFGFSYMEIKSSDIKKNIKKLIDNGLSEQAALASLTTYPAQLLGISKLAGTVEKGKIANLVITEKSYFDEKSSIKYVFVDGDKYDFSLKPKKDSKPSEVAKHTGTWTYIIEVPGSVQKGKIIITKSDGEYKIAVIDDSAPNEEETAKDIIVNENNITFNITADMGQPVKVDFDLTVDEKVYTGHINVGQMGTFPIKGEKESDPK